MRTQLHTHTIARNTAITKWFAGTNSRAGQDCNTMCKALGNRVCDESTEWPDTEELMKKIDRENEIGCDIFCQHDDYPEVPLIVPPGQMLQCAVAPEGDIIGRQCLYGKPNAAALPRCGRKLMTRIRICPCMQTALDGDNTTKQNDNSKVVRSVESIAGGVLGGLVVGIIIFVVVVERMLHIQRDKAKGIAAQQSRNDPESPAESKYSQREPKPSQSPHHSNSVSAVAARELPKPVPLRLMETPTHPPSYFADDADLSVTVVGFALTHNKARTRVQRGFRSCSVRHSPTQYVEIMRVCMFALTLVWMRPTRASAGLANRFDVLNKRLRWVSACTKLSFPGRCNCPVLHFHP